MSKSSKKVTSYPPLSKEYISLIAENVFLNAPYFQHFVFSIYRGWKFVFQHIFDDDSKKKTSSKRDTSKNDENSFLAFSFVGFPSAEQIEFLNQTIGACRFIWNRMLSDRLDHYNIMGFDLKITPADYKDVSGLEWLSYPDSNALSNVQLNLERAFSDYFAGEKGRPHFKKKGVCRDSYKTNCTNNNIRIEGDELVLPKCPGKIKLNLHREIPQGGLLKNCTVSHEPNGQWLFILSYEYPAVNERCTDNIECFLTDDDDSKLTHIGLDMSLPHLFVDSNGDFPSYVNQNQIVSFEKHYKKLEDRIAKEQRKLSLMIKDSNNYKKQCQKIAKLYAKAKHQRNDFLHQIAVRLAMEYDVISIEDLNMAAMKKSLHFGKSVSDNGWGNFTRILQEKCDRNGSLLIKVDKWFPSSKQCIKCKRIYKELTLNDRTYICPCCGNVLDRDYQAAMNIDEEGLQTLLRDMKNPPKLKTTKNSKTITFPRKTKAS